MTKNQQTESSKRAKQNQVHKHVTHVHMWRIMHGVCICCLFLYIQLYTRRAKYLKGREKDSIDPSFMSEERAHESEGELVMHRHTPVYRSEGRGFFCCSYSSASNTCILSRSQQAN